MRDLFENYGVEQFITATALRNEDTFRTFLNGCGKFIHSHEGAWIKQHADLLETNAFTLETLPFESTTLEQQTGFFHSTSIPIRTYRISRTKREDHNTPLPQDNWS